MVFPFDTFVSFFFHASCLVVILILIDARYSGFENAGVFNCSKADLARFHADHFALFFYCVAATVFSCQLVQFTAVIVSVEVVSRVQNFLPYW